MRIAILCTSNDTSDFAKRHITDDVKYRLLLEQLRPDWRYHCFAVWQDCFPSAASDYDGIIITGSPASVHDAHPWIARLMEFIRSAHGDNVPMFGGCFGHQCIALAFGGAVADNARGGWSIGQEVTRFVAGAPYGLAGKNISLYSVHEQEVTRLPPGAKPIGSNDFCMFPAFVMGDTVLTTQYHPEMTSEFLCDLVNELRGYVSDDALERARQEFSAEHEGLDMAQSVINFFEARAGAQ